MQFPELAGEKWVFDVRHGRSDCSSFSNVSFHSDAVGRCCGFNPNARSNAEATSLGNILSLVENTIVPKILELISYGSQQTKSGK